MAVAVAVAVRIEGGRDGGGVLRFGYYCCDSRRPKTIAASLGV